MICKVVRSSRRREVDCLVPVLSKLRERAPDGCFRKSRCGLRLLEPVQEIVYSAAEACSNSALATESSTEASIRWSKWAFPDLTPPKAACNGLSRNVGMSSRNRH